MFPQPTGLCQKCRENDAEVWFHTDNAEYIIVLGRGKSYCKLCVVKEQIEHAEEHAAKLSELYKELDKLEMDR